MIRTVAETHSTNDDVAGLARQGIAEGLWLRAERQTGGRGRQGRDWLSPVGNLYASTLVRLHPTDPPAPSLALVAAVALHEVACAYAKDAPIRIKWPNDLLVDGAKLSGILLERVDEAVIIGFGVNLASHPTDIERPATSFAAFLGHAPEPAVFLEDLAAATARWLGRWRSDGIAPVRSQWLAAAHPIGTALAAGTADGRILNGLFDGLDEDGGLRLRLADGSMHVIHAGDVFLL
ncbi:biotin--[acetyl-CoA-carboxylase] ligase [Sphingosinicella rhizophila]|uniref:biotin--[biotin carboxyl-carrier protein] ligase n=1 Tax=Sphingosinicella rhizophila TaxID=3050082 RepID=A0ABU3Q3F8_9SPHN|nr:biotin--[acetyl-CoA-carboxylase] ligase [Sphingosinicella sp. GR2756]MDT9597490.1 biotin--[acetyl-CoA-carboxylase] ligase [Sphingosinicella sp. GR2756]